MIDVDESGDLEKQEILVAVKSNQKVIKFLVNCGEPNLQNLLVPSRLEATLAVLDTDRDGHIDAVEWEACIESALANKLAERAARRELQAKPLKRKSKNLLRNSNRPPGAASSSSTRTAAGP